MTRSPDSPSNLHRRFECPGSARMEAGLPEVHTSDAEEGTELHRLAANPTASRDHLDAEQLEALERNEAMQAEFIEFVRHKHGLPWRDSAKQPLELRETEWWYSKGGKQLFAMHPDYAIVWAFPNSSIGIILDSKFGRNPVPSPEVNWQLKAYVCGMAQTFPYVKTIYAAITQPRAGRMIESTVYTTKEIAEAHREIEEVLNACRHLDAPRRPSSSACRYCRGFLLGVCQEARSFSLSVRDIPGALADSPEVVLARMEPADRSRLFEAFALASLLRETYTNAAKKLVERDPEFIPGWRLIAGGERKTVVDPMRLFERLNALGVTANEFIEICKPTNKELGKLVRAKTKLKGKELEEKIEGLLNGVVDRTPIAPSLERE